MNSLKIVAHQRRLEYLFEQISHFGDNLELQSCWAQYLCVLVSGFVETSVQLLYAQYAKNKAAPYVANYVESRLRDFQNPNMEKILQLARSFSPAWETELKTATEGEPKDAVDSIVANRHRIAHGEWVGITYTRMKNYYRNVLRVIRLIEEQCGR